MLNNDELNKQKIAYINELSQVAHLRNSIDFELLDKIIAKYSSLFPKTLYKYVSTALPETMTSMANGELFLKTPRYLNDPCECPLVIDMDSLTELSTQGLIIPNLSNNKFHNMLSINACKTMFPTIYKDTLDKNQKEAAIDAKQQMEYIRNRLFIGSLSARKNSMLMWSHYSNSHKGFCLGYDVKSLINTHKYLLLPVIYSDTIPYIDPKAAITTNVLPLISIATKSKDWSYEEEWRIVDFSKDINEQRDKITIILPKPTELLFGSQMSKELRKQLKPIAKKLAKGITCKWMKLKDNTFILEDIILS